MRNSLNLPTVLKRNREDFLGPISIFQVRGYDNTLSVRISESTVGLYLCRATVKDFKDVSASASVLMRGPPRILRSQRVQVNNVEG